MGRKRKHGKKNKTKKGKETEEKGKETEEKENRFQPSRERQGHENLRPDEIVLMKGLHIISTYSMEECESNIVIKMPLPEIHKHPRKLINVEFDVRSVEVKVENLDDTDHFFKAYYLANSIVPEKSRYRINNDLLVLHLEKKNRQKWGYVHYHHPKLIKIFESSLEMFMTSHFSGKPHESFFQHLRHFGELFLYCASNVVDRAAAFRVTLPESIICEKNEEKVFDYMKQKISNPSTSMNELYYFAQVLFFKERTDFERKYPHLSRENLINRVEKKDRSTNMQSEAESAKQEGNILFKSKRYHEAIILYTKAITLDCQNPVYFLNRGISYFQLEDISQCICNISEALLLNPFYSKAYLHLGKTFLSLCCPEKATEFLNRAKCLDFSKDLVDEIKKVDQLKNDIDRYVLAMKDENRCLKSIILQKILRTSVSVSNIFVIVNEKLCKMNLIELAKKQAYVIYSQNTFSTGVGCDMLAICYYYDDDEATFHYFYYRGLHGNSDSDPRYEEIKTVFEVRKKGDKSYENGKFEEAINWYQKGVSEELPCKIHATFLYKISCAKFKLNKQAEALEYLEKAIEKNPNYHEALSARGEYFTNEGKFSKALVDFEKGYEIYPSENYTEKIKKVKQLETRYQPKKETKLGFNNINYIDSKKAESEMEFAEHKKVEGNKHFELLRYDDAIKSYSEAIDLDSGNPVFYLNRSACYIMQKKFEEALSDSEEALKINPLSEKGLLRFSKCSVGLGKLNDAVRVLEKACLQNQNLSRVSGELSRLKKLQEIVNKGKEAMNNEEYKKAEQYYSNAVSGVEMCKEYHIKKIECLILSENYEQAVSATQHAIQLTLTSPNLYYIMGLCYVYQDEGNKAIDALEKSINLDPCNERVANAIDKIKSFYRFRDLGDAAYWENRFTVALLYYEKGLGRTQRDHRAKAIFHCNIGLIFMRESQIKDAIVNFTSAIGFQADYVKAYINRAECYLQINQINNALTDFEEINKICPCDKHKNLVQETKMRHGTVVGESGGAREGCRTLNGEKEFSEERFEEAILSYIESLLLSRSSLQMYPLISNCYTSMGNIDKAVESFEKVRGLDCNIDVDKEIIKCTVLKTQLEAAKMAEDQQSFAKSYIHYKNASEIAVDSSYVLLKVAESLIHLRRFDDVLSLLDSVPDKLKESSDIYCIKGLYNYHQKDDNKELEYLLKALELSPFNKIARHYKERIKLVHEKKRKGDVAYIEHNYTEALKFYEEGLQLDPENHRMQAKFLHNIGAIHMNKNQYNEAIRIFTKAISFKNDYIKAFEKRAKSYKQLDETEKAIKDYKKLFEITKAKKYKDHIKELKTWLKDLPPKNYYQILDVSPSASMEDIRKAYMRLAREYHPDKLAAADDKAEGEEKFKAINRAYSVLSDPIERKRYDRGETENDIFSKFPQHFMPSSFARTFFAMFGDQIFHSKDYYPY